MAADFAAFLAAVVLRLQCVERAKVRREAPLHPP